MGIAMAVITSGTSIMSSDVVWIGSVIEGVCIGTMTGAAIGAVGMIGMIVASGIAANFRASQPEMPLMPTNTAKLDDRIFQEALKTEKFY